MQLSPLQSRLVASLAATLCLLALYFLLLSPRGALAYEIPLDSPPSSWVDFTALEQDESELQTPSYMYEAIFSLFGRSILGRATDSIVLENNKPLAFNLQPGGGPVCYVIKRASLGMGSQAGGGSSSSSPSGQNSTVYVSANTCLQPAVKTGSGSATPTAPQLVLFMPNNLTNAACPQVSSGPNGKEAKGFTAHNFSDGAVTVSVNASTDIYMGVYAPEMSGGLGGTYNYEVAVSNSSFFHQYVEDDAGRQLLWMDSDSTSALMVTRNLTTEASEVDKVMSQGPPYELYVSGQDWPALTGLRRSACGLQRNAPIGANRQGTAQRNGMVKIAMTLRGPGQLPKQQFYIVGLNATTSYSATLIRPANLTVNGKRQEDANSGGRGVGSVVYQMTNFQTNGAPNCKVVTDLEFCDEIQYAVPGNDGKFNNTELAKVYDNYAKTMYANFIKVMQQVQCEADRTSKYSLARTCDDCTRAYKRWLCTVSLPRCEDFLGGSPSSVIRNVNQAFPNGTSLPGDVQNNLAQLPSQNVSRNSFIDATVQPGPYKEILPCEDICYQVVQSCPAVIGFKCPRPGYYGFNATYGRRDVNNSLVCNFPGEARTRISSAWGVTPNVALMVGITLLSALLSG